MKIHETTILSPRQIESYLTNCSNYNELQFLINIYFYIQRFFDRLIISTDYNVIRMCWIGRPIFWNKITISINENWKLMYVIFNQIVNNILEAIFKMVHNVWLIL